MIENVNSNEQNQSLSLFICRKQSKGNINNEEPAKKKPNRYYVNNRKAVKGPKVFESSNHLQ